MNAMKICIIVLVVIGVLAFSGISASLMGGQDQNDGTPEPWVETLRDSVARPRALRLDELQPASPDCRVGNTFQVQTACGYTIAKSDDLLGATRRLSITLIEGDEAKITLRQRGYVTTDATLSIPDRNADLDVYKEKEESPSSVTIQCNSLSPCSFRLRE